MTRQLLLFRGRYQGVDTARILLLALPSGQWDKANAEYVQQQSYTLPPTDTPEDQYPQFGVVLDGEHKAVFDLGFPPHEIDRLPSISEINEYKCIKADPTYRWSMKMYDPLMRGFDAFHEQVYQTVKDNLSSSNAIIQEVSDASPNTNGKPYGVGQLASRIDFHLLRSRRSCFNGRYSNHPKDCSIQEWSRFDTSNRQLLRSSNGCICAESNMSNSMFLSFAATALFT